MATWLPRYPVSFGRSCRGRKESEEESNGKIRSARLVTQRATLRIVARSTLTRTSSEVQGGEDDEGGGWAANLMGMQCGNFSLDLVPLSPPLPFLPPLCPHLVPAALTQPDQIAITNITYDDRLDDFSSPPSNRFLARRSVSEN